MQLLTLLAQARIEPSAEQILLIPFRLAVANHHDLVFSGHFQYSINLECEFD